MHFMDDCFVNLVQGWLCTKAISEKRVNSDFAMTVWRFWISDCDWMNQVQVNGTDTNHHTSAVLTAACVLKIHTSIIITVSVTRLCSPLGLELMVKLITLLTVFIFTLKAEARDYGKGCYISDSCLCCSANHNALGQLANQSRLCLSERGAL